MNELQIIQSPPADFMFQLDKKEANQLILMGASQSVIPDVSGCYIKQTSADSR
ncbi:hypothetical protein FACS189421_09570 [Bacteroidia bacterium]|nr:hypothetical protein FACS189421_09570 [Bacteroidia bacterium]